MFVLLDMKQLQPCQDTRRRRKRIRRPRSSGVGFASCGADRNGTLSLCSRGNRRRQRAVSVLDHRHSARAWRRGGRASQGAPPVTLTHGRSGAAVSITVAHNPGTHNKSAPTTSSWMLFVDIFFWSFAEEFLEHMLTFAQPLPQPTA